MGAPAIPEIVPSDRLVALTCKGIPSPGRDEHQAFPYLTDSKEWVVDDEDDRAVILESDPTAKFFSPHSRS